MNAFVNQNRQLLRTYWIVAQITGWVLLAVPVINIVEGCRRFPTYKGQGLPILMIVQLAVLNHTLLGLVVLGVAQLIRYLVESRYRPGWLLRNADKVLYVFSVLVVLGTVIEHTWYVSMMSTINSPGSFTPLYWLGIVLRALGKVSVLVGLGLILRRVMPVIAESKTLV